MNKCLLGSGLGSECPFSQPRAPTTSPLSLCTTRARSLNKKVDKKARFRKRGEDAALSRPQGEPAWDTRGCPGTGSCFEHMPWDGSFTTLLPHLQGLPLALASCRPVPGPQGALLRDTSGKGTGGRLSGSTTVLWTMSLAGLGQMQCGDKAVRAARPGWGLGRLYTALRPPCGWHTLPCPEIPVGCSQQGKASASTTGTHASHPGRGPSH
jgi:hypothetical protein